ncbi:NAD-dependent epimerase/dehydratase family protein [Synechococcus sp. RSCCF101]|uniref:NAD-dependent epimerase/dehydratase family protein n=1 Tax=Synechococcus sp. RSCCF101 TaxID=2511069 RepID=UPI001244CCA5|nr:NAD-dependent epimerase/dehydratase family protein [Synechococcus sp. RSCCF101]QEY32659.1 NAD-dependent epimerase/dehydratase family protein [Synechococcus sp. RSCCF101]
MEIDLSGLYQRMQSAPRPVLPSGLHRGIVGCGYVGRAVAASWRGAGHRITATATREESLASLKPLVDQAVRFRSDEPDNALAELAGCDGLLISLAPGGSRQAGEDAYRSVFLDGLQQIRAALASRPASQPLQLVYLSSSAVYGDRRGQSTDEHAPLDWTHPLNAVLAAAEQSVRSLRSEAVRVCVLRLGAIYGPGRDVPGQIRGAAGQVVLRNGDAVGGWIHRDDIVQAVDLAFDRGLDGVFNLVDDLELSGRDLADAICDQAGLPPVIFQAPSRSSGERVLNARIRNARIKGQGLVLQHPSMLAWSRSVSGSLA